MTKLELDYLYPEEEQPPRDTEDEYARLPRLIFWIFVGGVFLLLGFTTVLVSVVSSD